MKALHPTVFSSLRPGLIVRLGNLIVIQVVFVFVALALILFVPGSDQQMPGRLYDQERLLTAAGESLYRSLDSERPWTQATARSDSYRALDLKLDTVQALDRAALIKVTEEAPAEILFAHNREIAADGAAASDVDVSDFLDLALLRRFADTGLTVPSCPLINGRALVYYRKVAEISPRESIVLAVATDHGLSVSSRAGLRSAVLLLFLCAALISLLTVSLLLRKFKRPLDQIIAGLGETADGKLHHLAGLENDPEVGRLAKAYNEMTRRLWDNRTKLDSYYSQLETANAELRESRSFLATLIDSSPLSVIVTNPENKVVLFSRSAVAEFGYTQNEIVGQPFDRLLAEKGERAEIPVGNNGPVGFEVVCSRKHRVSFPAYVVSDAVRTEDREVLGRLYICRDITETRSLQDMMIRVDRYYTKGEMVGDIAHEINNYLAVLMGNVELMPLLLKKGDSAKIDKKLDVMKTSLEKIARFADGLLDSPPDAMRIEPTSVNQVVETVIGFLKPQNKFDTVEVCTELSGDVSIAHVDAGQIQQMLINLINNAAEALVDRAEDRKIWVSTEPAEVDGQRGFRVTVRDNGPGVARDKEVLLFNTRFTTKRRGHGIGLMTCRKIVDNHGGSISYAFSEGAVFSVLLPVECGQGQAEANPEAAMTVPGV